MEQHHVDHIRLLSSRFHELQGLRVAFTGACIALVVGGYLVFSPQPSDDGSMVALVVAFVPVIPGVWLLNRYYATAFGRQVWTRPRHSRYLSLFFFSYFLLAMILNAAIPSIPAGTPTTVTAALISVWVAIRDWPYRAYYLGVTAAVLFGLAMSASGAGLLPAHLTVGTIFVLLGASFVPVGVLDHLLLVKLMKEARQTQTSRPGI